MKRTAARTAGMLAITTLIAVFTGAQGAVAAPGEINVTYCHAVGKADAPYNSTPTTDPASIVGSTGHGGHTGPVYVTGMKAGTWGDIIPAFTYPGGSFPGLNVDGGGQAWLDRGCEPPPELTLVKQIVNTGGGIASATDWTLNAVGPTSISGQTGTPAATAEVLAGTYALSESGGPDGYTPSAWLCSNSTAPSQTVTIGAAQVEDITCTITNTFDVPVTEVTVAPLTLTPGSCTAIGSVNATDTADYTWSFTGPLDARIYTAAAIGDVVLVGDPAQGPFNLSQLDPESEECATPVVEVTVAPLELTLGSCTAIGSVEATDTADYTWGFAGPLGARIYTATAIGEVVLVGDVTQGPFDLSQLASQSDDPDGDCYVPPVVNESPVTAPTFTPGTCLANGSVVASSTDAYTWQITGTMSAKVYTAVAKATYTLTGQTAWTFNLSKTASQSSNPQGACYVAPPVIAPVIAPVTAPALEPAVLGTAQEASIVPMLPRTGAEVIPLGIAGLIVLGLGVALMRAGRRNGGQGRHRAHN